LVGSWFGKLTMTTAVTLSVSKGEEDKALFAIHGSASSP